MTSQMKFLPWALLALVWVGCQSQGPKFNPYQSNLPYPGSGETPFFASLNLGNPIAPASLVPPTDFYRLGPGDSLEIETLGEPQSRNLVTVGPDGKIYYSFLPGTFVWGMTLSEAKQTMEQGLGKFLVVKPELGLTLANVVSKRVWVLGQVKKPGVYALAAPMTLLEAISASGGTVLLPGASGEVADLSTSFVMRNGQRLGVNFYKLLRQGDMSQNIYLQPDDFVYLRAGGAKEVYVLGAVAVPTGMDYSEQMSLITAIARAGGTIPYAFLSQAVIVRGSLSEPMVATVDYYKISHGQAPDVLLAPGDIVYVPFRPTQKLEMLVDRILQEFVRAIAVNEGTRAVVPNAAPITPTVPIYSPR